MTGATEDSGIQDNYLEWTIVQSRPSTQPLETKGFQEFLIGISDLLKSAELMSPKALHATDYSEKSTTNGGLSR